MEIPPEVLNKLKCSECDEFLSCGPVYFLHKTEDTICGRCSQQSENINPNEQNGRTRIDIYEATASLLAFPCAFAAHGCPKKITFSLGQPPHESYCNFRPIICPIEPQGSCNWIGILSKLKDHCIEKHPLYFFENPSNSLRPDLTVSNLQTYLISAFQFLFLLHIKVCITSGKVFLSIQMFGELDFLDKFSFTLEIEGNKMKFTNFGSVLKRGIQELFEPPAICIKINSLLDILDCKYNESKFTITIKSTLKNCSKCLAIIENVTDSIFCAKCRHTSTILSPEGWTWKRI